MPHDTTIRRVQKSDLAHVAMIENAVFSHNAYPDFVFRQLFDSLPDLFFVAEADDAIIAGYAVAALQAGRDKAVTLSIAVDTRFRGRGCATAMLSALDTALAERGAVWHRLTVEPDNVHARALYEKCGFALEVDDPEYFGPGGHRLVMVKTLRPSE